METQTNSTTYSALADFYTSNFQRLVGTVSLRVKDEEVAKDIIQDAFVNILTKTDIILPSTIHSLVWTVINRLECDYWRSQKPKQEYECRIKATTQRMDSNPLALCSAADMTEWLERGMAKLTEPQLTVYRMNIYDGMKVAKISETLNVNYKTIENRLGTARKNIRQYMRALIG